MSLGDGVTAKQLVLGDAHACVILTTDAVKCWGSNSHGQLGIGSTTDVGSGGSSTSVCAAASVALWDASPPVQVSAGDSFTCALLRSGRAACWGRYTRVVPVLGVDLGESDMSIGDSAGETAGLTPIVFGDASTLVTQISSASVHSCAISTTSQVYCWGFRGDGRLGKVSSAVESRTPGLVDLGTGRGAVRIWAQERGNCVLLTDESMMCWGDTGQKYSQKAIGSAYGTGTQLVANAPPLPLPRTLRLTGSEVTIQTARDGTACIVYAPDVVQCWGDNRACTLGVPGLMSDVTVHYAAGDSGSSQLISLADGPFVFGSAPSPSTSPTPTVTPSVTITASGTPSPSVTATVSGTLSPSVTATTSGTPSPSVTATVSGTLSPSVTATVSGTPSPSVTTTATGSASAVPSSASDEGAGLRGAAAASNDEGSSHDFNAASIAGTVFVVAVVGAFVGGLVYAVKAVQGRAQRRAAALAPAAAEA